MPGSCCCCCCCCDQRERQRSGSSRRVMPRCGRKLPKKKTNSGHCSRLELNWWTKKIRCSISTGVQQLQGRRAVLKAPLRLLFHGHCRLKCGGGATDPCSSSWRVLRALGRLGACCAFAYCPRASHSALVAEQLKPTSWPLLWSESWRFVIHFVRVPTAHPLAPLHVPDRIFSARASWLAAFLGPLHGPRIRFSAFGWDEDSVIKQPQLLQVQFGVLPPLKPMQWNPVHGRSPSCDIKELASAHRARRIRAYLTFGFGLHHTPPASL